MLDAAESILLENGLDHLSMEDVADKAEVSKGSLYQYFQNKNDLVLESVIGLLTCSMSHLRKCSNLNALGLC